MKLVYFFVSVFVFAMLSACQNRHKSEKIDIHSEINSIINGREVLISDPFSKHIVGIYKKGEIKCTGVIVSQQTILTAAHCLSDVNKASIGFGLNKKKLQLLPVAEILQHPNYDETIVGIVEDPAHDVMIVSFRGALPAGYEPAVISDQDLVQKDSSVYIAGYGRDEDDEYDYLKVTQVNVVEAVPFEFRTEEKKSGSCDGDSGGHVFIKNMEEKYILAGSVSRGDPSCYQYGIYENMTFYKSWIQETSQLLNSKN